MIFRRLPASSSFVLAAARLRALQLDPWPRGGKDRAAARKDPEEQSAQLGGPVVTGLDPYALLTTMALMGADERALERCMLPLTLYDSPRSRLQVKAY